MNNYISEAKNRKYMYGGHFLQRFYEIVLPLPEKRKARTMWHQFMQQKSRIRGVEASREKKSSAEGQRRILAGEESERGRCKSSPLEQRDR
jgi:hypothetical protein